MELFSNKYLYYFTCLVADLIYLIWFVWCMFFPKKLLQKIAIFIVVYIFLTLALTILYFYLGSLYPEDLGLNSKDVAKWSRYDLISIFLGVGAFMAPIAVLLGFDLWKKQMFVTAKIKAIGDLKKALIKQLDILNKFWLEDNVSLLEEGRNDPNVKIEYNQKFENLIDQFEDLRWEVKNLLESDGFYFGIASSILSDLYKLHDQTYEIIAELDTASKNLKRFLWGEVVVVENNKDEYYQALYFISPQGFLIRKLKEQGRITEDDLIKDKNDKIVNKIQDFYEYLNQILSEIYSH